MEKWYLVFDVEEINQLKSLIELCLMFVSKTNAVHLHCKEEGVGFDSLLGVPLFLY